MIRQPKKEEISHVLSQVRAHCRDNFHDFWFGPYSIAKAYRVTKNRLVSNFRVLSVCNTRRSLSKHAFVKVSSHWCPQRDLFRLLAPLTTDSTGLSCLPQMHLYMLIML